MEDTELTCTAREASNWSIATICPDFLRLIGPSVRVSEGAGAVTLLGVASALATKADATWEVPRVGRRRRGGLRAAAR
eukprot:8622104-Pyramimonas_sp.AAC.1